MFDYETIQLTKGVLRIYKKGDLDLICYETKDPIDDQVILFKNKDTLISIEAPLFKENVNELNEYVNQLHVKNVYILLDDHVATKDYLPQAKLITTKETLNTLKNGGPKALFNGFVQTFAGQIQNELREDYEIVENHLNFGSLTLNLVQKGEEFDVIIPDFKAVYTHMLGHDVHSIIAGETHANLLLQTLKDYITKGYQIILTSHYIPETIQDVQAKIEYIQTILRFVHENKTKEEFLKAVQQTYTNYSGLNYLEMTASAFYPQ